MSSENPRNVSQQVNKVVENWVATKKLAEDGKGPLKISVTADALEYLRQLRNDSEVPDEVRNLTMTILTEYFFQALEKLAKENKIILTDQVG